MTAREALDRTVRLVRDAVDDAVADDVIVERLQSFRIRCVSDEANVSSHSGQTALVTAVSLIARMGVQIDLDVPDVELSGYQPPLLGTRLRTALVDLGADLVPNSAVTSESGRRCDLTLVLGDTQVAQVARGVAGWRVTGTAWAGAIMEIGAAGNRWNASCPIGAMTAAALVAPEVFKAAIGPLTLRHPAWRETLAPCRIATWDFEGGQLIIPAKTVAVDIISAGAITQAALFALFRLPLTLTGRIFDSDVAELSNINRQLLLRRSDSGHKVGIVARSIPSPWACTPVVERFSLPASDRHLPLATNVLVGVDDIPSRWQVQQAAKGLLGVGATSHFEVSTSSHGAGQACAGCRHPRDDPRQNVIIPTVSFVSFWAGLALAVRFLGQIGGHGYSDGRQHLWLSTLRMDQRNAARWEPVPARSDCPVGCASSRRVA